MTKPGMTVDFYDVSSAKNGMHKFELRIRDRGIGYSTLLGLVRQCTDKSLKRKEVSTAAKLQRYV